MYHGRYFRLDTDVANIEKGIVVFRYCPDGKTDSGIYVAFTDDEIVFHCNSRVDDTIKNATILHIPIDDNIEQNFAGAVTEAFHETIDDVTTLPQENPHLSYYSAFSFGANSKQVKNRKQSRTKRNKHTSHNASDNHLVRRLILDFLFDLKETRIFEMSPHYGDLTEKLRDNFFARCLIAKARYWYQRAFYESVVNESRHASSAIDRKARKTKRQFYGEILFQAEKEWADCIRDPRSDQTFHDEPHGWFDDSETEMRHIYLPHLPIVMDEGVGRKLKKELDKNISNWLVMRHAALTAWRILFFGGNRSFFGIHLIRPRIVLAIGVGWIALKGMKQMPAGNNGMEQSISINALLTVVIFAISWILIRRVVPLMKDIFIRALRFSCLVLLISCIIGYVLSSTIDIKNTYQNIFLASAFGLATQIFLRGGDPNDPM